MNDQVSTTDAKIQEQLDAIKSEDGVLQIGTKAVDLDKALPLTLGDLRKLEKLKVITKAGEFRIDGMDDIATVLHHLVTKVDKDVKLEDLDQVPIAKVTKAFLFVQKQVMETDKDPDPTRSSS